MLRWEVFVIFEYVVVISLLEEIISFWLSWKGKILVVVDKGFSSKY